MAKYKRGLQAALARYLAENPNRTMSNGELADRVPGWPSTSYSSAMNELRKKNPEVIESPTSGLWRWGSFGKNGEVAPVPLAANEVRIRVLKEKEGKLLVQDMETDALYTMQEFRF